MKINKRNPVHWKFLVTSSVYVFIAMALRPFRTRTKRKRLIMYGHQINGNLKAFYDYCKTKQDEVEVYFLAAPEDLEKARKEIDPIKVLDMLSLRDMIKVGRSDAVLTSHGTHTLRFFLIFKSLKFINVWHGVGWKGHDPKEFKFLKRYCESWVTSRRFRDIYIQKFRINKDRIFVTGYGRVDALVSNSYSVMDLKKKYQIKDSFKKIILLAPTWEQDSIGRNIIPFGVDEECFIGKLNSLAKEFNALVVFRTHMHSTNAVQQRSLSNIKFLPYKDFPQTEEILYLSDILVSDWSSIVMDYLPLSRPTIFLDVEPPFNYLSLNDKYRYGEKVANMEELVEAIDKYLKDPKVFNNKFDKIMVEAKQVVYDNTLDGKSTERYYSRLMEILDSK